MNDRFAYVKDWFSSPVISHDCYGIKISQEISIRKTILKLNMVWLMSADLTKIPNRSFRLIITNILHFSLQTLVYFINKLNWAKTIVLPEIFYVMVTIPHFSMNGKIWHTMKLSTFVINEMLLLVSTLSKNRIFKPFKPHSIRSKNFPPMQKPWLRLSFGQITREPTKPISGALQRKSISDQIQTVKWETGNAFSRRLVLHVICYSPS